MQLLSTFNHWVNIYWKHTYCVYYSQTKLLLHRTLNIELSDGVGMTNEHKTFGIIVYTVQLQHTR